MTAQKTTINAVIGFLAVFLAGFMTYYTSTTRQAVIATIGIAALAVLLMKLSRKLNERIGADT
jgi:hypothetical protein